MAAAGLPEEHRRKAIIYGIAAAAGLRIVFAVFTTQLLGIIGLVLAGGILLLWVTWKLWRELHKGAHNNATVGTDALDGTIDNRLGNTPLATPHAAVPRKTLRQALTQIVIADVSMSLDNVLAVAGAAREHPTVLIFGLALSIALMGLAASLIARLLARYHWIAWIGLLVILYVALHMIWEGWHDIAAAAAAG